MFPLFLKLSELGYTEEQYKLILSQNAIDSIHNILRYQADLIWNISHPKIPSGTIKLNRLDYDPTTYKLSYTPYNSPEDINTLFIYHSPHALYYYNQITTYIREMPENDLPITHLKSKYYNIKNISATFQLFKDIINDEPYLIRDLYIDRYLSVKPYDTELMYRLYVTYKFVPIYCASDYYLQRFGYNHIKDTGGISAISIDKHKLALVIDRHEDNPNINRFRQTLTNFQQQDTTIGKGVIFISTFNSYKGKTFTLDPEEFEIYKV